MMMITKCLQNVVGTIKNVIDGKHLLYILFLLFNCALILNQITCSKWNFNKAETYPKYKNV